jgi:hypothetical protein
MNSCFIRVYQEQESLKSKLNNMKPVVNLVKGGEYDTLALKLSKRKQTYYNAQ